MALTLERFAADCRAALTGQPGTEGREKVRGLVQQALADKDFVAKYIPEGTPERHILFEDPDLGFTILAHGEARALAVARTHRGLSRGVGRRRFAAHRTDRPRSLLLARGDGGR